MSGISLELMILAILVFGLLSAAVVVNLLDRDRRRKRNRTRQLAFLDLLARGGLPAGLDRDPMTERLFLSALGLHEKNFASDTARLQTLTGFARRDGLIDRLARRLSSLSAVTRRQAAVDLSNLPCPRSKAALIRAFGREKDEVTRLHLAMALVRLADRRALRLVLASLKGAGDWYARKLSVVLVNNATWVDELIPGLLQDEDRNIQFLLIAYGGQYIAEDLRGYLLRQAWSGDRDIARKACASMAKLYPMNMQDDEFLHSTDPVVRASAIRAVATFPSRDNIERLAGFFHTKEPGDLDRQSAELSVYAISSMVRRDPGLMAGLIQDFQKAGPVQRQHYARILSFRLDYFLFRLLGPKKKESLALIRAVLEAGLYSDILGFLNRNTNRDIEQELLPLLGELAASQPDLARELRTYGRPELLEQLGLRPLAQVSQARKESWETAKAATLAVLLVLFGGAGLGLFVLANPAALGTRDYLAVLRQAVIDYNWLLVWYSLALNAVYLGLVLLSVFQARTQDRMWRLKKRAELFFPGLLPPVTIIAPAYKEEASIVQSVHSLLNLEYPDHELVVVNDGSPDSTLKRLIDAFELEKVDVPVNQELQTQPVRGVYRNPRYPNLTVLDKENGGKADSLNAGLNYANKDYFCGIDADSLLEPEALLKLASLSLDSSTFFAASGGNILPVNGCTVADGALKSIDIPRGLVARFQTVEYLRAFLAGRVGWSRINGLLIISGAFGLFHKDTVKQIGGYLTARGRYHKDTVGEDMELVVRLRRHLQEQRIRHRVHYAFNANCWTEVPETLKSLHRQRDRWHRGLIDSIFFHRRLLGNPRHGVVGTIAFPYFVLFEILGPLVEAFGYLMVLLAGCLGLLNLPYVLLLFFSTVVLGIFVSLSALALAGQYREIFPPRTRGQLILSAILENFGFRQLVSLWRFTGYLSAMRKPRGWGQQERRGFTAHTPGGTS